MFCASNAGFQWPPCKVFVFTKDLPGILMFDPIEGSMTVHCKPLLGAIFDQLILLFLPIVSVLQLEDTQVRILL